jgi:hypothetical protein
MVNVLKANGKIEPFDESKLVISVKRTGVPENLQNEVINTTRSKLYDNIPTSEIYKNVYESLHQATNYTGRTKYSIKQSIMDLGPTGYPFEDYVSYILTMEGYKTQVRQTVKGKCISHEIDVIAEKDNLKTMIECKFHNAPGIRSQCHVPMYTKARFDDVKEANGFTQAMLITNTKITPEALNYALCVGMKVISWDYPEKGSFRDLIDKYKLYPITCFTSLTQNQKQQLLLNHVILSKNISENPQCLDILGLPKEKYGQVLEEAKFVSST